MKKKKITASKSKKRAKVYETKLKINASFSDVIKVAMEDKNAKKK